MESRETPEIRDAGCKRCGGSGPGYRAEIAFAKPRSCRDGAAWAGPRCAGGQDTAAGRGPDCRRDRRLRHSDTSSPAVLARTQTQAKRLHNDLAAAGVATRLLEEGSSGCFKDVVVCTPHLAKGLVFDRGLVPDASAAVFATEVDRNLIYVAFTRAMHRLSLISVGAPSQFLARRSSADA